MSPGHHGPSRRTSTSSTLSHADSFHSLELPSHEPHDHKKTTSHPQSGVNLSAFADACSPAYMQRHGSQFQVVAESMRTPSFDQHEEETPRAASMERKDSKFTIASASSSTGHHSSRKPTSKSSPSSRRPSMTRQRPSFSQSGTRPSLHSRRNTQTQEELYAAHAQACALFPSTRRTSRTSSQIYSAPASQASLPRLSQVAPRPPSVSYGPQQAATTSLPTAAQDAQTVSGGAAAAQSQTVIDWMSPATRRNTYEKYDRDRKGLRGLWRKLTPDCFWRGSRTEFYDEKFDNDDDAKSVRRHRLDLDELDGDSEKENKDPGRATTKAKRKPSFNCFAESKKR